MSKLYDVIIAGAGPVGLLLASELALAHTSVLVLESEPNPKSPWKVMPLGMRGLNTLSVESFYRRGLLNHFIEPSQQQPSSPHEEPVFQLGRFAGHFAGIMLDSHKLDLTRWKYRLPGPALIPNKTTTEHLEAVLTDRCESLGVTILRGDGVTKIAAHDEVSVVVETSGKQSFRGRWLVGCDGGRSVVRKAAGFDFIGTEPKYTCYTAICDLDSAEKLLRGINVTDNGMYISLPPNCLHLVDFDDAAFDRAQEITQEHLQDVLKRVTGFTDVKVKNIHLVSSSTDRCKQASHYCKGRILLAGDAAHINSPLGAQGLNLGLGDAMNLGWKLAATIHQESEDLTLLDTYELERHPIAAWVLAWTRAQISTLQPNPYGAAIRTLVQDLIATKDGTNLLVDRVWGLSQRYDLGSTDPLVGSSAPDIELRDGSRVGPRLEGGKGLLVTFEEDDTALKRLIVGGRHEARVESLGMAAANGTCGLRAMLVRPDGIVAWVAAENEEPDLKALEEALKRWFGF